MKPRQRFRQPRPLSKLAAILGRGIELFRGDFLSFWNSKLFVQRTGMLNRSGYPVCHFTPPSMHRRYAASSCAQLSAEQSHVRRST